MRRRNALPELLAPAGSFDALTAAVRAGADAVYVGGKSFGARAYAKNFDFDELRRASIYTKLHGKKLYITLNTLIYDKETEDFRNFVKEIAKIRPDALIMADLGAISIVKEIAPDLEIHASTQMSVHNTLGADEAYRLGAKRVVLARELELADINSITDNSLAETEIFLHGALCVCHSGQCLMSSLVGGRSGNRGECAQPCRLPYNGKYPISLSDLSLSGHINELIESGVASLKVEGRMKSAEYVYTVTRIYRRLLDERRNADSSEEAELAQAFTRGFTDGYFTGKINSKMTGVRSADDKRETREAGKHDFTPDKMKITASATFLRGLPSRLTLTLGDVSAEAAGAVPNEAENSPLEVGPLKARLAKMGNTFFSLSECDIELKLDKNINLAPSAVNALRRDAVSKLEEKLLGEEYELFDTVDLGKSKKQRASSSALFLNPEELVKLSDAFPEKLQLFGKTFVPLWCINQARGLANGVYIPPVITEHEISSVRKMLSELDFDLVKYALIGNISHVSLVREYSLLPIGDFRLNICNRRSLKEYEKLGISEFILSPEITLPMARDIGGGEIVYGRIPLMLTERCFIKENFGCNACGRAALTDRTGAKFPMIREWEHRNLILNSTPTYMGDKQAELSKFNIGIRHFIFSTENAEEISRVISAYCKGVPIGNARRVGKR